MIGLKRGRGFRHSWFVMPAVILILVITGFPLVYSFIVSTFSFNLAKPQLARFIGMANYLKMFSDSLALTAMRNTLIFVAEAVSLQFLIGLGLALFFSALPVGIKGEAIFRTCLCIPMMVTPILAGLMWRYMLSPLYGVASFPLAALGLPKFPWYTASSTALFSLVVIDTWMMTPFMFLLFSSGLKMISRKFYEAAQLDGASRWQRFLFITMPLLKPVIFVAIAIRTVDAFRLFDEVFVLTKGGPGSSTEVISINIWRVGFKFFHVGYAAAMSYVILAIILVITIFLYKTMGAE